MISKGIIYILTNKTNKMTKIGVTKNSAKKRRDAYVRKHKLKGF